MRAVVPAQPRLCIPFQEEEEGKRREEEVVGTPQGEEEGCGRGMALGLVLAPQHDRAKE